jgi:hypothetical protein
MGEYLSRLKKNTETLRAGTDKTDTTPRKTPSVSFVGTLPRAYEKNTPPEPPLPCTLEWLRGQGCHVLPEDLRFIEPRLPRGSRRRNAALRAYVGTWRAAMEREPLEHRKDGRGRFAANTALLEGRLALEVRHGEA